MDGRASICILFWHSIGEINLNRKIDRKRIKYRTKLPTKEKSFKIKFLESTIFCDVTFCCRCLLNDFFINQGFVFSLAHIEMTAIINMSN